MIIDNWTNAPTLTTSLPSTLIPQIPARLPEEYMYTEVLICFSAGFSSTKDSEAEAGRFFTESF